MKQNDFFPENIVSINGLDLNTKSYKEMWEVRVVEEGLGWGGVKLLTIFAFGSFLLKV